MDLPIGFCVRINAYEGYAEKIMMLQNCTDYTAIAGIRHKGVRGENPHYHLVVKTEIKDQAFRVRMKKIFDQAKGNQHMSIKSWDGDIDAVAYLFHEDPEGPLMIQHGFTDEYIAEARARNKHVQEKIEVAKERASWKLEDEVFNKLKPSKTADGRSVPPTRDEIAKEIILTALRGNKYMPNDYLLKAMVIRLQFRYLEGDVFKEDLFADSLIRSLYYKFDN